VIILLSSWTVPFFGFAGAEVEGDLGEILGKNRFIDKRIYG